MSGKFVLVFLVMAVLAVGVMSHPQRKPINRRPRPRPRCSDTEVFRECGSACEPSCDNQKPQICTMQCIINVCQCKEGLVRNREGICVQPCEC